MKAPAFQFYVRDWLTDTELSQCSPATRGIWADMLCAMWIAPNRGKLENITPESLSRIARCTADEADRALQELEESGAASVTRNGKVTECHKKVTVVCRRMAREEKERKDNADRQKRHRGKRNAESNSGSNTDVTPPSASASAFCRVTPLSRVTPGAAAAATKPSNPDGELPLVIPAEIDTPEFRSAWEDWRRHRKEIKKKLTPLAVEKQVKLLAGLGAARAVAAIEHSIANGYTGIIEPKPTSRTQPPASETDIAAWIARSMPKEPT